MHTNLDETKIQVLFLPVNIYVEDQFLVQQMSFIMIQLISFSLLHLETEI